MSLKAVRMKYIWGKLAKTIAAISIRKLFAHLFVIPGYMIFFD